MEMDRTLQHLCWPKLHGKAEEQAKKERAAIVRNEIRTRVPLLTDLEREELNLIISIRTLKALILSDKFRKLVK